MGPGLCEGSIGAKGLDEGVGVDEVFVCLLLVVRGCPFAQCVLVGLGGKVARDRGVGRRDSHGEAEGGEEEGTKGLGKCAA